MIKAQSAFLRWFIVFAGCLILCFIEEFFQNLFDSQSNHGTFWCTIWSCIIWSGLGLGQSLSKSSILHDKRALLHSVISQWHFHIENHVLLVSHKQTNKQFCLLVLQERDHIGGHSRPKTPLVLHGSCISCSVVGMEPFLRKEEVCTRKICNSQCSWVYIIHIFFIYIDVCHHVSPVIASIIWNCWLEQSMCHILYYGCWPSHLSRHPIHGG